MIVIYDNSGRITQTFMFVAPSLKEYAETVLEPAGAQYLFWEGDGTEITTKYIEHHLVYGADLFEDEDVLAASNALHSAEDTATFRPFVVERPTIAVSGDVPQPIAVGQEITLNIDQAAQVRVITNGQVIASETVNDGVIELSFSEPGKYTVQIGVDAFPIIETEHAIEVV